MDAESGRSRLRNRANRPRRFLSRPGSRHEGFPGDENAKVQVLTRAGGEGKARVVALVTKLRAAAATRRGVPVDSTVGTRIALDASIERGEDCAPRRVACR